MNIKRLLIGHPKGAVSTSCVKPLRDEDSEAFNTWCNETGASRGYSKFKPFEDPNLVADALDFKGQLKTELIKSLHKLNAHE